MECPNSALHCWMMCLSNNQTGKPHIYMHLCPGPFTPSSRFASATHLQFRPIETASNVPPHHKRRLLPPRAEPNDYDVGVEARVEASESRLPRAKEAKPLRLGNRSAGQSLPLFIFAPPATLLHRLLYPFS